MNETQAANVRAWLLRIHADTLGSVRDLARLLRWSTRYVKQLLDGEVKPSQEVVARVALVMQRTENDILTTTPSPLRKIRRDAPSTIPEQPTVELAQSAQGSVEPRPAPVQEQVEKDLALLDDALTRELYPREADAFRSMRARVAAKRPLTFQQREWLLKACYRHRMAC